MYTFSNSSKNRLETAHPLLQLVFNRVIELHDCTIVDGYRNRATQNYYYKTNKSKLKYPKSKHNSRPSLAVDVVPYIKGKGIVWGKEQCYIFAGYVMGVAGILGVPLRNGADWNMNTDIYDESFVDLTHFELLI